LAAVADLELIEAPRQHREDGGHAPAHRNAAAGEDRVAAFVLFIE